MRPRPARRPKASCYVTSVPYPLRRGRRSGQRSGRTRGVRPRCGASAYTVPPPSLTSRPAGLRSPTRPDAASAATGKKVAGRKRHYLVDTEGHLLLVLVGPADEDD